MRGCVWCPHPIFGLGLGLCEGCVWCPHPIFGLGLGLCEGCVRVRVV